MIFLVSGPSGSGKTTLLASLVKDKDLRRRLARSVSITTRPRRFKERQRKDYYFIDSREFARQRQRKKILEWTRYLGYYYATPRDFVQDRLAQGKSILLSLDLKGARLIKRSYPDRTITIFILPPSLGVLRGRIENRSPATTREEIQNRLKLAQAEVLAARRYDYCLINDDLQKTLAQLKEIVLEETGC
ncbi:MAG: guanylate kinase [Candidatus Omnitrophota bacterium]|nr:guanylate kinase [Candidatus Omnitrophota bacterium]